MPCGDPPCSVCGTYHTTGMCWRGAYSVGAAPQPVWYTFPMMPLLPQRLHPDDIEAIAKRVVEMIKAATP